MKNYTRINNIVGWFTFLIAWHVFISTIEPTGSFWHCEEFTATTYKLEVGHPPGAPLFMTLGKIFTLFSGNDLEMIPVMVNIMSALMNAFAILFLFLAITAIAKKIMIKTGELTDSGEIHDHYGCRIYRRYGLRILYLFWFTGEGAEVYASSPCFTACCFGDF